MKWMIYLIMYSTMNNTKGNNLVEGDLVVVFGKLDGRIREKSSDELVIGTLYSFLTEDRVCVIIGDNELWVGKKRDIALATEQQ